MLRKINALMPSFFKELDRKLLLNRPEIWATKIHYLIFLGVIGLAFSSLYLFIKPLDLANIPNPEYVFTSFLVISIVSFLFWGWQTSKFDVEKTHGMRSAGHGIKNQLILAIGVGVLIMIPFFAGQMLSNKIANTIDSEEFIHDVNSFNIGAKYFDPYLDYTPHVYWKGHTSLIYSEAEIAKIHKKSRSRESKLQLIKNFIVITDKYGVKLPIDPEVILNKYKSGQALNLDQSGLNSMHRNFKMIDFAKGHFWNFQEKDFRLSLVFLAFMSWLMLLVFQKNNWKNFFLSIVVAAGSLILGILTSVLFHDFLGTPERFTIGSVFYSILGFFLIQAYSGKNSKRRKSWKEISLNIATFMTPFIPFITVLFVDISSFRGAEFDLLYLGAAFAIFMWNAAYHPQFVKLQSIPKEN